ncbi:MAG: metal-dependent hydrolase [Halobacteriales archaeon]
MATTHLLAGMLLAMPVVMIAPELATPALLGAAVGSVLPDLDLYVGHRRTLHFPHLALWFVPPAAFVALASAHPAAVALALGVVGMALHARMDIYGGGLELRPWEGGSDRAVYDHLHDRWLPPRRFVRYDGAPEDVAMAVVLAIPLVAVTDEAVRWGILVVVGLSVCYGLVRKPIVDVGVILLHRVPRPLLAVLPMRYLEDELVDGL